MFMKAVIAADDGRSIPIMTMGPICIAPELKRKGYGKILLDYSLEKAKELKEIRSDINVELFASIFENVFLGSYLSGIVYTDGYKIEQLEREVMQIYQLIKA